MTKGGEPNSMESSSSTRCRTSSSGTTAQPERQPVMACDFERLETPAHVLLGALDREHARVRAAAEHERGVDLVGDEPEVVLAAEPPERCQRLGRHGRAGRVVRRRQHDRARALADRRLDLGDVELEAALRAQRDVHGPRPGSREHARIGRVVRLGDDHLVALADDAVQTAKRAACAPGKKTTRLRIDRTARPARRALRDRLAQRQVALRERVVGATARACSRPRRRSRRAASRSRDRRS